MILFLQENIKIRNKRMVENLMVEAEILKGDMTAPDSDYDRGYINLYMCQHS